MIKVFEAFAGYGSQRMALRNLGIRHEIVGISEIDGNAILSYAAIHTDLLKQRTMKNEKTPEEMYTYLEKINAPLCYKTFINTSRKLKKNKLNDMFLANKLSKNFGDITRINPKDLPDFDLFTYSFPCQDISVAGFQKSLSEGSGTRSSLLWECCKIIETKKPKYLMMENVKNLIGKNHRKYFEDFLVYLEKQGYVNKWKVLNAKDYGVPQRRERIFCISVLDTKNTFEFPTALPLEKHMCDILEKNVPKSFYLNNNQVADEKILPEISYCLDANYWKGTTLNQYLSKSRRQLVSGTVLENGKYPVRRLTPLETWRLMGCTDQDFIKASQINSNTNLYKQAGNSIVVPVLEAIFRNLFIIQKQYSNIKQEQPLNQIIFSSKKRPSSEKSILELSNNTYLKEHPKSYKNKVYQLSLFD